MFVIIFVLKEGQSFYLVKWCETWEPTSKLEPMYQNFIEDFWERINVCGDAKNGIARPPRKVCSFIHSHMNKVKYTVYKKTFLSYGK